MTLWEWVPVQFSPLRIWCLFFLWRNRQNGLKFAMLSTMILIWLGFQAKKCSQSFIWGPTETRVWALHSELRISRTGFFWYVCISNWNICNLCKNDLHNEKCFPKHGASCGLVLTWYCLCADLMAYHWNKQQKNYTIRSSQYFAIFLLFSHFFTAIADFLDF